MPRSVTDCDEYLFQLIAKHKLERRFKYDYKKISDGLDKMENLFGFYDSKGKIAVDYDVDTFMACCGNWRMWLMLGRKYERETNLAFHHFHIAAIHGQNEFLMEMKKTFVDGEPVGGCNPEDECTSDIAALMGQCETLRLMCDEFPKITQIEQIDLFELLTYGKFDVVIFIVDELKKNRIPYSHMGNEYNIPLLHTSKRRPYNDDGGYQRYIRFVKERIPDVEPENIYARPIAMGLYEDILFLKREFPDIIPEPDELLIYDKTTRQESWDFDDGIIYPYSHGKIVDLEYVHKKIKCPDADMVKFLMNEFPEIHIPGRWVGTLFDRGEFSVIKQAMGDYCNGEISAYELDFLMKFISSGGEIE